MACIFCSIAEGKTPAKIFHDDEHIVGFYDIHPQAPVHALFIPRKHISTLNDLDENDAQLLARLFLAAKEFAQREGIAQSGYRLVMNCNSDGGQTVYHLHLHVFGGRWMKWPPG